MKYNDIPLPGLIGSNPLGALAAFGLLRVCNDCTALSSARLYWTQEHDWIAVLRVPHEVNNKQLLIKILAERQEKRPLSIFNFANDIRVPAGEYREKLDEHAKRAALHDRLWVDYFAAFGSEIVLDGSKHLVKPTAFYMVSGRQKFLDGVRKLGASMQSESKEAFEEALFGPWKYADKFHSLGWDPSTERLHALRAKSPSAGKDVVCVRGAVWLAIEALPLFPTAAVHGKLATTGFTKDKATMLVWPVWTAPIGLDTLKTLLMTSDDEASLYRRGVAAIYRSIRSETGQGGRAVLRSPI